MQTLIKRNPNQLQACPYLLCFLFLCLTNTVNFLQIGCCGNLSLSESIGIILLTPFAHVMSWCHVSVLLAMFQASSFFSQVSSSIFIFV